jgi:nucleoside-diphosphate-sugar epimerase
MGCRKCKDRFVFLDPLLLIQCANRIAELQADTIARRYPNIRLASIRLHWSVPSREYVAGVKKDLEKAKGDLWGYVQEDCGADAFLLALTAEEGAWQGHEAFFVAAPDTPYDDVASMELRDRFYRNVPTKEGKDLAGNKSFFDCSKAERLLGWKHNQEETM